MLGNLCYIVLNICSIVSRAKNSMDVLTDVLNTLELKGWLSSRRELAPPWRYDFVASQDSMFHVLSFGGAYLQVEGEAEPIRVEDGDVVLFPTGHPHSLYDDPAS